jgi:hypothetical protein
MANMKWDNRPKWRQITPDETRAGTRIGYREDVRRPFWIALFVTAITAFICFLFENLGLSIGGIIIAIGAWSQINASETDADSPLNQTLFDKIRGNLDHLFTGSAQLKFLTGSDTTDTAAREILLDDDIDWLDRYVLMAFAMVIGGNANTTADAVLGGNDDDDIYSDGATGDFSNCNGVVQAVGKFLYTEEGDADGTAQPRVDLGSDGSINSVHVFADSGDSGKLKMRFDTGGLSGFRECVWHMLVIYSEDRGIYS